MSKHDNSVIRDATGAFNRAILESILPPIRTAAQFKGYAVAVHGSLKRDIDLVAIAWTEQACPPAELISAICGAVGGVLGNCLQQKTPPTDKPHGRLAVILIHPGFIGEIDLSVIPPKPKGEPDGTSE